MIARILTRRDTTANWSAVNPTLDRGEFGVEFLTDGTKKVKIGDGVKPWNTLDYFEGGVKAIDFDSHISNNVIHINATERTNWNNTTTNFNIHNADNTRHITSTERTSWNNNIANLNTHVNDTNAHTTGAEKTAWNNNVTNFNTHNNDLDRHTTGAEKATWNAKYDKPVSGIPKSDLTMAVQDTLDLADSAIQQNDLDNAIDTISGLQNIINNNISGRIDIISGYQNTINDNISGRIETVSGDIYTQVISGILVANEYTDTEVSGILYESKDYANKLSLATQQWLNSVNLKTDLLDPPPNPEQTWLCKVIRDITDNNGVYQWVGGGTEWDYFDPNWDYVTDDELEVELTPIKNDISNISGVQIAISGLLNNVSGRIETVSENVYTKQEINDSVVKLTGNQTIAGDKTFTSNIIIPTPTSNNHGTNKEYVDNQVSSINGVSNVWEDVTVVPISGRTGSIVMKVNKSLRLISLQIMSYSMTVITDNTKVVTSTNLGSVLGSTLFPNNTILRCLALAYQTGGPSYVTDLNITATDIIAYPATGASGSNIPTGRLLYVDTVISYVTTHI